MLLELTRWLQQLESLFGLFGYLTFRGILAALTSLFLSLQLAGWTVLILLPVAVFAGARSRVTRVPSIPWFNGSPGGVMNCGRILHCA